MTTKEGAGNWAVALTVRFKDGTPHYSPENEALISDYHLYLHAAAGEALPEGPTHKHLQELEAILRAHGFIPENIKALHASLEPHTYEPPSG